MAIRTPPPSKGGIDFVNWLYGKPPEAVKDSAKILGNEMNRLYQTPGHTWTDAELRKIVDRGYINDDDGIPQTVSPEARAAAKTILDNGGLSAIGNGDGDTNASELLEI